MKRFPRHLTSLLMTVVYLLLHTLPPCLDRHTVAAIFTGIKQGMLR